MKKILIALITFTIGLISFYLLDFKQVTVSKSTPVQYQTPIVQSDFPPKIKVEKSEPFFSSFKKDEGYYGWLIADKFKGMKEVWTILLSRDSENSKTEKYVWSARILTQDADGSPNENDFHSVQIKTENNRLSFTTNKFHKVEYKFEGKFFENGKVFEEGKKVLKGTMQKFVKGKKVAEFTSEFAYYEPQCWH